MRQHKPWAVLLVATAALVAGCGSSTNYANDPRPPALVTITCAIVHNQVRVSPNAFGAGPVMLVVANLTSSSQQLTITGTASGAVIGQTGPINPGSTATLQLDLTAGAYALTPDDPNVAAGRIVVGPSRPSSQNQVNLP
jgi:hypothetical protein